MAAYCTTDFVYVFILFVTGTYAESDSVKSSYIEYGLENAMICNPANDKVADVVELRTNRDSAIMIKPSHVFDSWQVKYNKHCKFKIKAFKTDRLFAAIQRMSLRRNGSECLDYIRFTPENENEKTSEKYCGKLNIHNGRKYYIPNIGPTESKGHSDYQNGVEYTTGMFEAFSKRGKITTEIFISKQWLSPGESLDLLVTYTPYKDCTYDNGANSMWTSLPHYNICISSKFVCDGYTNCATLICSDETNCPSRINQIVSDGTGTRVTVSAVTTIFLCFIIFILCLWICRKHKKLCWSPDCAGPSSTVSGNTSGLPMEHGEQSAPNPPYVSTAPMLEVAVPASVHDKDLPPSYDSLFPSQANTANM